MKRCKIGDEYDDFFIKMKNATRSDILDFAEHIAKMATLDLQGCCDRRELVIKSLEKERDALQDRINKINLQKYSGM